jgi:MFS family permease
MGADYFLTLAVYLLGFAAGSLVSGPLSEILGRNVVYTASLTLFMIFIMGSALAPNIGAQLAFRFLAGIFGCPPLTCAGGTIADLWNPLEKTIYFPMYAILSFGGPVLGPVIASYMGQTGALSWRWTAWIILIMSGAILVLIILFQPETYSPLLLKWKGKQLRRITGDNRFRSEMDMEKIALFSRISGAMKRQFLITIHEPIILLISLYMTVLYIVLFTFFDGYTYIFTDVHGLSQGLTNIVWVAMYVGISLATFLVFPIYKWTKKEFTQAAQAVNGADPAVDAHALDGVHTQPEIRLWFAMFGAPAIPISLFWMGWTDFVSSPHLPIFPYRGSSFLTDFLGVDIRLVTHTRL